MLALLEEDEVTVVFSGLLLLGGFGGRPRRLGVGGLEALEDGGLGEASLSALALARLAGKLSELSVLRRLAGGLLVVGLSSSLSWVS